METQNVKKCSLCGAIKPLDLYHKCSKSKDGYMAHCKSCHAQYAIRAKEKQKLFDAIKANGYEWDAEIKILEKLIVPKFKVGDRVKHISAYVSGIVVKVNDKGYHIDYPKGEGVCYISFELEKDYELAPNKFDITTLKPFESRVLVRTDNRKWVAAFYSHYDKDSILHHCVVGGLWYKQCIPYKGNEHLLDTTNDCDEYFKTWK